MPRLQEVTEIEMCAYRGTQHSSELHIFFKVVLVDNSVKINILCNVSIQKKTFIKILYRALMNINILLDFDAIRHKHRSYTISPLVHLHVLGH